MGLSIMAAIAFAACEPQLRQPYIPGPVIRTKISIAGLLGLDWCTRQTLGEGICVNIRGMEVCFLKSCLDSYWLQSESARKITSRLEVRLTIFLACAS